MKKCSKCGQLKEFKDYYPRNNRKSGVQSWCKNCDFQIRASKAYPGRTRARDLKLAYGITLDEYRYISGLQDDRCAICKKTTEECITGKKKFLCVDHNHETGKVRGLLCDKCNRGIGLLGDNIDNLNSAIDYLDSHFQ